MTKLAQRLAAALSSRGLTLATAESCTAGGLSHALTDVPGASAFFLGGVIAYHNDVKAAWLDVPAGTLDRNGAVSSQTAAAMAEGCRRRFEVDLAVSITGIAGPTGGTPSKPVGLVFIAVATRAETTVVESHFAGDRAAVRQQAVERAMQLILAAIEAGAGA